MLDDVVTLVLSLFTEDGRFIPAGHRLEGEELAALKRLKGEK